MSYKIYDYKEKEINFFSSLSIMIFEEHLDKEA